MTWLKTEKEPYSFEERLLCPICDFDYIHLLSIKVATNRGLTIVDHKGTTVRYAGKIEECEAAADRGGYRIIAEYVCENGHRGYLIFQFHEGNIFVSHEVVGRVVDWEELWRG